MTEDARRERDAREWMLNSFPGCKIFENRVQSLAHLLKRFYDYGADDAKQSPVAGATREGLVKLLEDEIPERNILGLFHPRAFERLADTIMAYMRSSGTPS